MKTSTIDEAKRLCRALGVKIVPCTASPVHAKRSMITCAGRVIAKLLVDHGQTHVVTVLRAMTDGAEVNQTMIERPVIMAVSDIVLAHPGWVALGGRWLEAWDGVDLKQIRQTAKAAGIRPLRQAIGALIYSQLERTLGPVVAPSPPARKPLGGSADRMPAMNLTLVQQP